MAKIQNLVCGLCLLASVAINLWFCVNLYVGGGWWSREEHRQGWTQKAAEEAEAVAAVSCSGHGRAYLDGSLVDRKPVCECNTCFAGPDCSQFLSGCAADAESGDPVFLEPFWKQHAASSAVLIPGWHRMSYTFSDDSRQSIELEKYIRRVHSVVGNAVTTGRYIIYGVGSSQLLNAAVYSLSSGNSSLPSKVVASVPYYQLYSGQTDFFRAVDFSFKGDASSLLNKMNTSINNSSSSMNNHVIEFVTSPNNPDCILKKSVFAGEASSSSSSSSLNVTSIYDHAYYWPHFTPIPAPADEDLMIFTLSKLTGHAGSRFGWALIKDKGVYERMKTYIQMAELGISRETQLRAWKLLKAILEEGNEKKIFEFGYQRMRDRWERLTQTFARSKRFSIQQIPPQYCNFFHKVREPSPAYAWVKCEKEEDKDCNEVMKAANIIGRRGSVFGADSRYTRFSLLKSQDDFELLLHRISELIASENGPKTM